MTGKQIKYYQTLFDFVSTDYLNNPKSYLEFLKYCTEYDFVISTEIWEIFFIINENEIIRSRQLSRIFSSDSFYMLYEKSEQKAVKALIESTTLMRALFQYITDGIDAVTTKIIVDFILSNKLTAADEALKNIMKNTYIDSFGATMKQIMEKMFIEILKKVGGGKAVLSKKQSAFLLNYINKIKTTEKAMLLQRLKEISF